MNGYDLLANAVVEQAATDYTKALCATRGKTIWPKDYRKRLQIERTIESCERFFLGDDIKLYTTLDGKSLMTKLQQEAEQYNYNYKKIIKSRHK